MSLVLNKLIALLWKCIIVRKSNWLLTIFELISPILLVLMLWGLNKELKSNTGSDKNVYFDYVKTKHSSDNRITPLFANTNNNPVNIEESIYIAYTPNTAFTNQLMRSYKTSVETGDSSQKLSVEAQKSEAGLKAAMLKHLLPNSSYRCVLGVMFSDLSNPFKYSIIGSFVNVSENIQSQCAGSTLFKLQVYFDNLYLKSMGVNFKDTQVLVEEFRLGECFLQSYSSKSSFEEEHRLVYLVILYIILVLAYSFLVAAVVRDTIEEKSSGIKELMRIMGVASWMIWIHWFIYSMLVHIPVSVVITVLLTVIKPHLYEANAFIVWFLLLLVTIDYIVIFYCVTCFFNRATRATVLCILGWIVISLALLYVISPGEYSFPVQVVISLIPLINLTWTLDSLHSFHLKNIDWNLSYLFTKGYAGSQIPAGAAMVILICEIILFTLLLAYLDAVKPGKYGVAKPLTFIFKCFINLWQKGKQTPESETTSLPSEFELPPPGTKVGIEIRGLHKEFGVFKKVVAVESVNLDIYEGEVTVLLGHNGAGKTTTMSMITGMFSPTSGTVSVDNKNIFDNLYDYRQNLGLCTQHNLYFPKLTVMEHLLFFGMLKGRSLSKAREEGTHLLCTLNLVDKKDFRASKLSGGMLRRLCLAVALTGCPKVLILDEPTSGLDPENRRHIWDIILSLRGERTILITTHYMEEADVLGDRIAIMDHGKVVCCGTTMFLKKLYGTGYNIHVTKKQTASLIDITQSIQRFIPDFETKVVSPAQVDYRIKNEFVERFPDLFSFLDSSMSSLGVTAISVSCTTMEDVFLRVAELSEEQNQDHSEPKGSDVIKCEYIKVESVTLCVQRIEALIMKRALYISKHFISTILKLIFACLFILAATIISNTVSNTLEDKKSNTNVNRTKLDLMLSQDPVYSIYYNESNKETAEIAQNIIKSLKGARFVKKLVNSSYYVNNDTMYKPMNKLLSNMAHIASASNRIAFDTIFHKNGLFLVQHIPALSPSANAANILLKLVYLDKDIEIMTHNFESKNRGCSLDGLLIYVIIVFFLIAFISCALTIVMADFIPIMIEERVTGFKYQQIIAGVSPFVFRLSSFICDFCLYMFFIVVSLLTILIFGRDVMPLSSENMRMLLLVLILYGVSFIIFLNAVTHVSNSSAAITSIYVLLNVVFMFVCPISLLILRFFALHIQIILTSILSLHPTAAVFFALFSIACGIANDSVCPINEIESYLGFPTSTNRNSILLYLLFLVIDTILYSVLIIVMDSKICSRIAYKRSTINDCREGDDDVKNETQRVRMYKEAEVDTFRLRVEGLVKSYSSFVAANNVSFLVASGECFGLLGVNGAGKTTTFKMLTGELFPSSGDAFCTKYSVVSQTQKYLSNIGYCPQFFALLDELTGNNILTIIAKIRGVPRSEVRNQVDYWMMALSIKEHGDKRTKTYSGGTKRKLGTAMAFIGEPLVTLLDEPTTGVDPAARRKVWSAVKDRQSLGYSAVLSSHSMEECEALCSRLTIMRQGELCCIGSVQELKTKFGQGFVVLLKLTVTEDYQTQFPLLEREFMNAFPSSTIQDENINMITYRILDDKTPLSRLFFEVIRFKKKYSIVEDFIVSSATLEQLFLAIARGKDVSAAPS